MRSIFTPALVGLALLLAAPSPAQANDKLRAYAQDRARDSKGRFTLARPLQATGWGNPSGTGQGKVLVEVQPATRTRAGQLSVKMPEYYRGSSWQESKTARPLYLHDGKQSTEMPGTLTVQRGSRDKSFSKATLQVTIPAGTPLTRPTLSQALRGVHVKPLSLKFAPLAPQRP